MKIMRKKVNQDTGAEDVKLERINCKGKFNYDTYVTYIIFSLNLRMF